MQDNPAYYRSDGRPGNGQTIPPRFHEGHGPNNVGAGGPMGMAGMVQHYLDLQEGPSKPTGATVIDPRITRPSISPEVNSYRSLQNQQQYPSSYHGSAYSQVYQQDHAGPSNYDRSNSNDDLSRWHNQQGFEQTPFGYQYPNAYPSSYAAGPESNPRSVVGHGNSAHPAYGQYGDGSPDHSSARQQKQYGYQYPSTISRDNSYDRPQQLRHTSSTYNAQISASSSSQSPASASIHPGYPTQQYRPSSSSTRHSTGSSPKSNSIPLVHPPPSSGESTRQVSYNGQSDNQAHNTPPEYQRSPIQDLSETKKRKAESDDGEADVSLDAKDGPAGPVFVACTKCRSRKIKCGGQKPACLSCVKRNLECCYDAVVKRRGPDKNPGGRVKSRETRDRHDKPKPREISGGNFPNENLQRGSEHPHKPYARQQSNGQGYHGLSPSQHPKDGYDSSMGSVTPNVHMESAMRAGWTSSSDHLQYAAAPLWQIGRPEHHQSVPVQMDPQLSHPMYSSGPHSQNRATSFGTNTVPAHAPQYVDVKREYSNGPALISPSHNGSTGNMNVKPASILNSPSRKIGLQDLVSGYDTAVVQQAKIVKLNDNGEQEEEDVKQNVKQNGKTSPTFCLERLPDLAYARDSDWSWMTGLFSSNPVEGMKILNSEIRDFFSLQLSWFAFFNKSLFVMRLNHPEERFKIQPSLILSILAVITLAKSSKDSPNGPGRQRALMFAEGARSMLQQSVVAQSIDPTMAQAALALTAFEAYPHPEHSTPRFAAALISMDTIIRAFQLLAVDVNDERASIFIPGQVPLIPNETDEIVPVRAGVESRPLQLTSTFETWCPDPVWPTEWTIAQIRQDEMRRMCWIASSVAGHFTLFLLSAGKQPLDLYLTKPENYALFFTAEALLIESNPEAGKNTIWALFNRVTLLWHHVCSAIVSNGNSSEDRLTTAEEIWHEADRIEKAMSELDEDGAKAMKWQANDWLLNLRLLATDNFRNLPAMFGADKAKKMALDYSQRWLTSQSNTAKLLMTPITLGIQRDLSYIQPRSFYVWSLCGQASIAIDLFDQDHTATDTSKVAETLLNNIEQIASNWPCETLSSHLQSMRRRYKAIAQKRATISP